MNKTNARVCLALLTYSYFSSSVLVYIIMEEGYFGYHKQIETI